MPELHSTQEQDDLAISGYLSAKDEVDNLNYLCNFVVPELENVHDLDDIENFLAQAYQRIPEVIESIKGRRAYLTMVPLLAVEPVAA